MEPDIGEHISYATFVEQQIEKFVNLIDEESCDYFWKAMIDKAYKQLQQRDDDYGRKVLIELLYAKKEG